MHANLALINNYLLYIEHHLCKLNEVNKLSYFKDK